MSATWFAIGPGVGERDQGALARLTELLPTPSILLSHLATPAERARKRVRHDAVALTHGGVYAITFAPHRGTIRGGRDRWVISDGTCWPSPELLAQARARSLAAWLGRRDLRLAAVPVHPLVLLTAPDAVPHTVGSATAPVLSFSSLGSWLGREGEPDRGDEAADWIELVFDALSTAEPVGALAPWADHQLLQELAAEDAAYEAWIARARLTGERKLLHLFPAADPGSPERERGLREATLQARLRGGPDLLRYDGYLLDAHADGAIALAFEDPSALVSLASWIDERSPGLQARLRVGARAARALQWMHDKEVAHRRLTADRVLVSPEDDGQSVRLCAFDLVQDGASVTPSATSPSGGGLRFCAPEVVLSGEATTWSDRFALGAVLLQLLTGRPVFTSVEALLRPVDVPALLVGDRPVPPEVRAAIAALLAGAPQARPGAGEVADILEQHGMIDHPELIAMLGSDRAARRFGIRYEAWLSVVPFRVRVDMHGGTKRYLKDL